MLKLLLILLLSIGLGWGQEKDIEYFREKQAFRDPSQYPQPSDSTKDQCEEKRRCEREHPSQKCNNIRCRRCICAKIYKPVCCYGNKQYFNYCEAKCKGEKNVTSNCRMMECKRPNRSAFLIKY